MKISLNWLKQFVDIPKNITPENLAEVLTLKTVEVEGVERQGKYLENVVVGKIKEIKKHPNADKLKICMVDVGEKETFQIVCGGINLREGMLVAVSKIGAKVRWHGDQEVEIAKTKIRGVESNGMICTAAELGLENIITQGHEAEIVDLEKYQVLSIKYQAGTPLAEVLGLDDVIFDIDNKSITNRPDLWGHLGIAREVAAICGGKLNDYGEKNNFQFLISNFNSTADKTNILQKKMEISVTVKDPDLCLRYMAVAMSGIKIKPSPAWMQKRLSSVGMRHINNIVDITNFVMLELGQPMHAFSKLKVKSEKLKAKIIVRKAENGEKIKTLDGVERELDESMLVIADKEKPIAIAGIMGGANSEIDEHTTEIILECANFEKVNNRKTAAKLGLRTEASARYEKGFDPNLCEEALARCIELIREIIPEAAAASEVVDMNMGQYPVSTIAVSLDYIRKKMGVDIEEKRVVKILESLGFGVEIPPPPCKGGEASISILNKDGIGVVFKITVPSWRATGDISIPDDIVEEVARIYGYDNINLKMPNVSLEPPLENKERILERRIKNILSLGFGMAETSNYSFVNEKQLEILGMNEKCVKLANPISAEHTLLRPSLIPNLLNNVKNNLRYFDEFAMFEIGSVFRDENGDIPAKISNFPACDEVGRNFLISSDEQKKSQLKKSKQDRDKNATDQCLHWQEKFVAGVVVMGKNAIPFFKAKEAAVGLLRELGVDYAMEEGGMDMSWTHPYRSSKFKVQSSKLGEKLEISLPPACAGRAQAGNWKLNSEADANFDIGYVTELSSVIAEEIGIKNARVGVFNLSLKALLEFATDDKKYEKFPKYPSIIRDLAVIVGKSVLYKDLADFIEETDKLITNVELFDIFENEKLGADKKSMAFHITFHSRERTLTDGEVDGVFKKIVRGLEKKFGAEMRS